jgi:hypothetical protein
MRNTFVPKITTGRHTLFEVYLIRVCSESSKELNFPKNLYQFLKSVDFLQCLLYRQEKTEQKYSAGSTKAVSTMKFSVQESRKYKQQ